MELFRERLTSRLDELGLGKSGLASIFEEMDVSGRGELTVKELSAVLFKLNFHVSKVTSIIMDPGDYVFADYRKPTLTFSSRSSKPMQVDGKDVQGSARGV